MKAKNGWLLRAALGASYKTAAGSALLAERRRT